MKYILLLRHAKSSWTNPELEDFDRPLAGRGLKDAPRMGKYLRKIGYKPEYIVSSTAERAKETTQLCVEAMRKELDIVKWSDDLYFESVQKYIDAIHSSPESSEIMMLVGHNPLIESAVSQLIGGNEQMAVRVPTAGLVCLESYAYQWADIRPGTCQLKWMMIPKVLKEIID